MKTAQPMVFVILCLMMTSCTSSEENHQFNVDDIVSSIRKETGAEAVEFGGSKVVEGGKIRDSRWISVKYAKEVDASESMRLIASSMAAYFKAKLPGQDVEEYPEQSMKVEDIEIMAKTWVSGDTMFDIVMVPTSPEGAKQYLIRMHVVANPEELRQDEVLHKQPNKPIGP